VGIRRNLPALPRYAYRQAWNQFPAGRIVVILRSVIAALPSRFLAEQRAGTLAMRNRRRQRVLDLNDFRFFVEVVDRGGFSAAGRALERSTSTISFRIQQLERALGLVLLARTTRQLNMTPAGEEFYLHAQSMLERAAQAEHAMRGRRAAPSGVVRFTVGVAVAQFAMADMLVRFMDAYPGVELVQHATDAAVDIVAEGYDIAIRAHSSPLPDSGLVQRPLAEVPWHLFASPGYLARAAAPATPAELGAHAALFMRRDHVVPTWHLRRENDPHAAEHMPLHPRMLASCVATLKRAAAHGMGIVALPAYHCRDEVRHGGLVRVLPGWVAADARITALMPSRWGLSAAARAFVDHLAKEFPGAVRIN
jgi:DNA-binding transcriptional LysR family regulator